MKAILGINEDSYIKIKGKELLLWNIEALLQKNISSIYLVGNAAPRIPLPEKVAFLNDPSLGDGGLLSLFRAKIKSAFVYIPSPLFFNVALKRALKAHRASGHWFSIFAGPSSSLADKRVLIEDEGCGLRNAILEDEPKDVDFRNLVDLGVYLIEPEALDLTETDEPISFFKDILMPARVDGLVGVYHTSEYIRDLKDVPSIERAIEASIPEKRNLSQPQKAMFVDRDGTINEFGDFVVRPNMLTLMKKSVEAIKLIDESEFIPIVITNQPIIELKEATLEDLDAIHARLETLLAKDGAYIQDLYFCPHRIDKTKEWNAYCECRKPKIGMLLKAKERYNIDLSSSWMIGDTSQDVQTGINAGAHSVLLHCGDPNPRKRFGGATPDFEADDLLAAIKRIIKK